MRKSLFLFFLLVASSAWPLNPSLLPTQYILQQWNSDNGLPQNTVSSAVQTRDGYLWFGTEEGLVRFDGVRFSIFQADNTPAFRNSAITDLREMTDGSLWVGTRDGVVVYKARKFRRFSNNDGLTDNQIDSLFQDSTGRIWISTKKTLCYFENGSFHEFRDPAAGSIASSEIIQTENGALWVLNGDFVYRIERGSIQSKLVLPGPSQMIYPAEPARVWVAPGGIFGSVASTVFEPYAGTGRFGSPLVFTMLKDRQENLWFGTNKGLYRFSGGRLQQLPSMSEHVTTLFEDREGSLWIGTNGRGLFRLRDPKVESFGKQEGLPATSIYSVLQDRAGGFWLGTLGNGLVHYQNGISQNFQQKDGLPHLDVLSLFEDSGGTIWAGTADGLARRTKEGKFEPVPLRQFTKGLVTFAMADAGAGRILLGTSAGTLLYDSKETRVVDPSDGDNIAVAFAGNAEKGFWIATYRNGLKHWDGKKVRSYTRQDGLPVNDILSLHPDGDTLWAGTLGGGLIRYRDGKFVACTVANGLFNNSIFQILEDGEYFWMSCNKGIFRVRKSELNDFADGKTAKVHSLVLGKEDGMRTAECNGGSFPAGWKATDGSLWFPTVEGVVRIDPRRLESNRIAPAVVLEAVSADDHAVDIDSHGARIPPGQGKLMFQFTAPSFITPDRIRFQFQLEGFDHDWVDGGNHREAYYTNIPPGRYVFHVRASNESGEWSNEDASFAFYLAPHFYQTPLFYAAMIVLFLLALFGAYRLRIRQLRKRFALVLDERNRISREIHDSLTQSFAGVVLNLEAAELVAERKPEKSREHMIKARELARDGLSESRRFIRGLRPLLLETNDLPAALAEMVRQSNGDRAAPSVLLRVAGRKKRLSPETEDQLLRIAQEGMNNALRHAGAKRIFIELLFEKDVVRLCVADDGSGFEPAAVSESFGNSGFGLVGMRERVQQLSGELKIQSRKGGGTRIEAVVPV